MTLQGASRECAPRQRILVWINELGTRRNKMAEHKEGQIVKGKNPPTECPDGFYWRKVMGLDAFKLLVKKERKAPGTSSARHIDDEVRLTVNRVALGIRNYMQNEEGFKEVVAAANLSGKALQNLALWATNAATAKVELEQVKATAVAKANAALRDAGLMIGPDGAVQPIPTA